MKENINYKVNCYQGKNVTKEKCYQDKCIKAKCYYRVKFYPEEYCQGKMKNKNAKMLFINSNCWGSALWQLKNCYFS